MSFKNKKSFYSKIDTLPRSEAEWMCQPVKSEGDVLDAQGNPVVVELQLWKRNPLLCIKELISNPLFQDNLRYAPEELFEDICGNKRMVNEMWTAEWWHDLQVS